MPTKRGDWYHVARRFGPVGMIRKTLDTQNKREANRREKALLWLKTKSRWDLLEVFDEGRLSIGVIEEAYEQDSVRMLERKVGRGEQPLTTEVVRKALDWWRKRSRRKPSSSTLARYRASSVHIRWHAKRQELGPHSKAARKLDAAMEDAAEEERKRDEEMGSGQRTLQEALLDEDPPLVHAAFSQRVIDEYDDWRVNTREAAQQTVNNDHTAIRVLAKYAAEQGWLEDEPVVHNYSYEIRISYLEPDELRRYFHHLDQEYHVFMHFLVASGLRLGEAESLVVANLKSSADGTLVMVTDNKTSRGQRPVHIPQRVAKMLKQHIQKHGLGPSDRLFGHLKRRTVQKAHNRACREAGIHDYTIHDHRHTNAVHLVKAGMSLQMLRRRLGHADIKTTLKYADFSLETRDVQPFVSEVEKKLELPSDVPDEKE